MDNERSRTISLLVAVDASSGIAKFDADKDRCVIPWPNFIDDRRWMKGHIQNKVVVMGRRTYEEIQSFSATWLYSNSVYGVIVVSTTMPQIEEARKCVVPSVKAALALESMKDKDLVIFGGAGVYKEALESNVCDHLFITRINKDYQCDVKLPHAGDIHLMFKRQHPGEWYTVSKKGTELNFTVWVKRDSDLPIRDPTHMDSTHICHSYREACHKVFTQGLSTADRTGVGTAELQNLAMRFNMSDGEFPFDGALRECSWDIFVKEFWYLFIKGGTNARELDAMGVPIWNKDTAADREVPDGKCGVKILRAGDMGPMYGFVLRHYGAEYVDCTTDYTDKGMDQLQALVHKIRSGNPSTMRRMGITTFDPRLADQSVLWPCHGVWTQFIVRKEPNGDAFLDCVTTQRSADMALGVPYNIAQYALLLTLIAHVTGLRPGHLNYNLYQAHIYKNHQAAMRYMLSRPPIAAAPFLKFQDPDSVKELDDFHHSSVVLTNYSHNGHVPLTMNTVIPPISKKRASDQIGK